MTRSASLGDSRQFPRHTGSMAGLCPTTWSGLPPRPSLLWVNAPSLRAIAPPPRGGTGIPQLSPRSQRLSTTQQCVSSSIPPDPSFRRDLLTTLQRSLDVTARKVVGPPGPVRPGVSSGRRGRLHPSLPEAGHPNPESGMITPPFWGRTMTGLAPAGALPIQAARFVANFHLIRLLTAFDKWTCDLSRTRAASRRHVFETNVNRFALLL